jgi:hypothetical protein
MSVTHKMLGAKGVEKMFTNAVKKSKIAAEKAMEDTTFYAHEVAVNRANRVVLRRSGPRGGFVVPPAMRGRDDLRPFHRYGHYMRSIQFRITNTGRFIGKIMATVNYGKKLEDAYKNLAISANIAQKRFPEFMKQTFKEEMRKKQPSGKR